MVLDEIGRRYDAAMADVYPKVNGTQPWGYLWAVTLPCQECGDRFPLPARLCFATRCRRSTISARATALKRTARLESSAQLFMTGRRMLSPLLSPR